MYPALFLFVKVSRIRMFNSLTGTGTRQGFPPEIKGLTDSQMADNAEELFNLEKTRAAEMPSANGHASARGEP